MPRKDKLSKIQKQSIAKLNPSGKAVDLVSKIVGTSKSTVYKAKREGNLLNQLDQAKQEIRELQVQNIFLKTALSSKGKKSAKHS